MTNPFRIQLFLLTLIFGFLAGPRIMSALQGDPNNITAEGPSSPQVASVLNTDEFSTSTETTRPGTGAKNAFEVLTLDAKSVYVWDIEEHRILFAKNERTPLPLASVTKMMMALVAVELLPEDQHITIQPVDLTTEGDSGLLAGEQWTLAKLLDFTLVSSSNDGASAIASVAGATLNGRNPTNDPFENKKLFIQKMNEKARSIGLSDTYFKNESGLDIDSITGGAYGTSRDMAMLFEYIFKKHPELFSATTYPKLNLRSESNIVHHISNTNEGVATVAGIIGSKTGYTDLAGGNLVVIVDIGIKHPIVISVLGSTHSGRFTDTSKLIQASLDTIISQDTQTAP